MDEQPSARVHQHTIGVWIDVVALSFDEVGHSHLTRRQQIDTRNGLVSNRDLAIKSVDVETREAVEVCKQRAVGRAHSQFDFWHFGKHSEKACLVLGHQHLARERLNSVGEHFIINYNYYGGVLGFWGFGEIGRAHV